MNFSSCGIFCFCRCHHSCSWPSSSFSSLTSPRTACWLLSSSNRSFLFLPVSAAFSLLTLITFSDFPSHSSLLPKLLFLLCILSASSALLTLMRLMILLLRQWLQLLHSWRICRHSMLCFFFLSFCFSHVLASSAHCLEGQVPFLDFVHVILLLVSFLSCFVVVRPCSFCCQFFLFLLCCFLPFCCSSFCGSAWYVQKRCSCADHLTVAMLFSSVRFVWVVLLWICHLRFLFLNFFLFLCTPKSERHQEHFRQGASWIGASPHFFLFLFFLFFDSHLFIFFSLSFFLSCLIFFLLYSLWCLSLPLLRLLWAILPFLVSFVMTSFSSLFSLSFSVLPLLVLSSAGLLFSSSRLPFCSSLPLRFLRGCAGIGRFLFFCFYVFLLGRVLLTFSSSSPSSSSSSFFFFFFSLLLLISN